jgi:hypothetical protein
MNSMNARNLAAVTMIIVIIAAISLQFATAEPTGASVDSNSTAGSPTSSPDSLTDPRGTITTIVLSSLQQDQYWKAYVGNITGQLSLDDASGNTIYDWALASVNKSGEVYVSRYNAITWSNISCINLSVLNAEMTFFGMAPTSSDSINNTYNYTSHAAVQVGTTTLSANSCRSTATYRSDVRQAMDGSQRFQALIIQDNANARAVYMTVVNNSFTGFDNRTYDFQIIIPEASTGSATTYYFFTELSG